MAKEKPIIEENETEQKPVRFFSKYQTHTLCMKPQRKVFHDGEPEIILGEHIRFANGEYETADEKEIKFLRKHKFYGAIITEA